MNRISISNDVLVSLGLQDKIEFVRFSLSQRVEHFVLIFSFTMLSATGLPQKFNGELWAQWMINMSGGIETTRWLHHFFAIVFILEGIYHVAYIAYEFLTKKVGFDMVPNLQDFKDFYQMVLYYAGRREDPPRFGRYDYKQKFEYFAIVWGWICMVVTGLIMWKPVIATQFLPGILVPAGKMLHSWEAVLAVLAIVIWHGYHALLHPDVFPVDKSIFTGKMSRKRMIEEHPLEYERLTGQPAAHDGHKKDQEKEITFS